MKRRTSTALLIAALAALGYYFLRPSDEDRIRSQLATLAKVVAIDPAERDPVARPRRIEAAFDRILLPRVQVEVPEVVEDVYGRDDMADMAASVSGALRSLDVDVGSLRVEVDQKARHARVTGTITLAGTNLDGGKGSDVRDLVASFQKVDAEWRLAALTADLHEGDHAWGP